MIEANLVHCIVYDLDGVLLDTEPLYTRATQEIVAPYGKTFDWRHKRHMIGRPAIESARYLVQALELPMSPEEYLQRRTARLVALFAEAEAMDGAERFTRSMHALGVAQAVATSSEWALYVTKVHRHRDWFSVFAAVVTGDDPRVGCGKPAPDIFLIAAREVGVVPEHCLVIEDSPAGVEAARMAGMQVIAMPDPGMDRNAYRAAHRIISGFDEIDPHEVAGLPLG